ncbi:sigma-70 family RNA polymerase sigma factor [Bacteroidales bacterium OttesenSCG-928-I21]|nr:sigma-70 family RNA polymerase sigma factor [Bacteroidales bacterium OttesenSCG-928-I21]
MKKISNQTDEELLEIFREEKDLSVFGELYRRYIPLVYGLCLKYLENKESANDAVMDLFEHLSGKIFQYEIKNFRTWLYSVSKNHCLQMLRKDKNIYYVKIEDVFVENNEKFTLIDKPQSEEEMNALTHCITTLPDEQRASIQFFYLEEKSYADIVDLTGFPLNKVKSYIQNGKRNLKSCIIRVLNN